MPAIRIASQETLRRGIAAAAVLVLLAGTISIVSARAATTRDRLRAGTISTIAGGVGGPGRGTAVILGGACGVTYADGSVFVGAGWMVRVVNQRTGILTTPAGTGVPFQMSPPLGDAPIGVECHAERRVRSRHRPGGHLVHSRRWQQPDQDRAQPGQPALRASDDGRRYLHRRRGRSPVTALPAAAATADPLPRPSWASRRTWPSTTRVAC